MLASHRIQWKENIQTVALSIDRPNLIMTQLWMERFQELAEGLEKIFRNMKWHWEVLLWFIYSTVKKKSNAHLNSRAQNSFWFHHSGLEQFSCNIRLSLFEWLVCFTVLDDSRYQNLASWFTISFGNNFPVCFICLPCPLKPHNKDD